MKCLQMQAIKLCQPQNKHFFVWWANFIITPYKPCFFEHHYYQSPTIKANFWIPFTLLQHYFDVAYIIHPKKNHNHNHCIGNEHKQKFVVESNLMSLDIRKESRMNVIYTWGTPPPQPYSWRWKIILIEIVHKIMYGDVWKDSKNFIKSRYLLTLKC